MCHRDASAVDSGDAMKCEGPEVTVPRLIQTWYCREREDERVVKVDCKYGACWWTNRETFKLVIMLTTVLVLCDWEGDLPWSILTICCKEASCILSRS